jgi:hypothetical protein
LTEPAFQATNTPVVGTKYNHQRSTQEVERGIFERFAKAAGLDVVDGSITQPDPPDIVCEIVGLGAVGFELTAVDDTAALTRMALNSRTAEFWAQALASLDPSTRARLRASHSDVQVALEYAEPGHKGERRTAMRAVLERLAEQAGHYVGPLYNRFDLIAPENRSAAVDLARERFKAQPAGCNGTLYSLIDPPPPGIRRADVQRFDSFGQGPIAFGISPGGFAPINLHRIDAKLSREDYRSDQRLELLAYVRWGDAASLEDRDFADYLAQRVEGTPFIRIWLFETAFAQVVAHYP